MKRNRLLISTLPLAALLMITFIVLAAVNYPHRARTHKNNIHNTPGENQSEFAPITNSEQLLLANENKLAYWIKNASGEFVNPLEVNPMINIQVIYNYYNAYNQGGKYGGIRFYPAYANKTIFLIMCLAEGGEGDMGMKGEIKYIKLDQGLFLSSGTALDSTNEISAAVAKSLHDDYMNYVYLYKKPQNITVTKDSIKYSRYFAWGDFQSLTEDNINVANIADYLFQIEIGYVTEAMAVILGPRARMTFTKEQNQGFTTLIHVKNKNGISLLDPFSKYNDSDPAEKNNYAGRVLEVATPCPPRCGVNH